jgi:hypothetical protein
MLPELNLVKMAVHQMLVKEIIKPRRTRWRLSQHSQLAMVRMDQPALRESFSQYAKEISQRNSDQENKLLAEPSHSALKIQVWPHQKSALSQVLHPLFNSRPPTTTSTTTNITIDKTMLVHLMLAKEPVRQKMTIWKLRPHYQSVMVPTEPQELTADWPREPRWQGALLNKMVKHQPETRETQQLRRMIPQLRHHYHHVLRLQRDPSQVSTAEQLFHCAAIHRKEQSQELIADLHQRRKRASLRDKIISFKYKVMIKTNHSSTQDQTDSTSQSFPSAPV